MISIQSSISELERLQARQDALMNAYLYAIRCSAQYAVQLDEEITEPHRRLLNELADEVAAKKSEDLGASQATLRGLLRDYRDKAGYYLKQLRGELTTTARALQAILDSLAQSSGDHETQLRQSVTVLRQVSEENEISTLRAKVRGVAESIEAGVEQIHKDHQLTVAQFLMEIHVLHQRIDSLEAAASMDNMTGLHDRRDLEDRIRSARPGSFHLLLFQAHGIRRATAQFGGAVGDELAAAFAKRLKNCLPEGAILGRWSPEEFMAIIGEPRDPKVPPSRWATDQLSGGYSCLHSGKTVRPALQVTVGIVDSVKQETPDRTLDRVKMFLTGV